VSVESGRTPWGAGMSDAEDGCRGRDVAAPRDPQMTDVTIEGRLDGVLRGLARRVRQLREQRDLSVAGLSFESGLSESRVRAIEAGRTTASLATLVALAETFEIEVSALFVTDDDPDGAEDEPSSPYIVPSEVVWGGPLPPAPWLTPAAETPASSPYVVTSEVVWGGELPEAPWKTPAPAPARLATAAPVETGVTATARGCSRPASRIRLPRSRALGGCRRARSRGRAWPRRGVTVRVRGARRLLRPAGTPDVRRSPGGRSRRPQLPLASGVRRRRCGRGGSLGRRGRPRLPPAGVAARTMGHRGGIRRPLSPHGRPSLWRGGASGCAMGRAPRGLTVRAAFPGGARRPRPRTAAAERRRPARWRYR